MWRWRPLRDEEEEEEEKNEEEEEGRKIPTKIRRCRAHTSPMAPFCAGPHTTSTVGCFRGRDGSGKACREETGSSRHRRAPFPPGRPWGQHPVLGTWQGQGDQGLRWTHGGDVLLGGQHSAWGGWG